MLLFGLLLVTLVSQVHFSQFKLHFWKYSWKRVQSATTKWRIVELCKRKSYEKLCLLLFAKIVKIQTFGKFLRNLDPPRFWKLSPVKLVARISFAISLKEMLRFFEFLQRSRFNKIISSFKITVSLVVSKITRDNLYKWQND